MNRAVPAALATDGTKGITRIPAMTAAREPLFNREIFTSQASCEIVWMYLGKALRCVFAAPAFGQKCAKDLTVSSDRCAISVDQQFVQLLLWRFPGGDLAGAAIESSGYYVEFMLGIP
jgi:hypothetical protein